MANRAELLDLPECLVAGQATAVARHDPFVQAVQRLLGGVQLPGYLDANPRGKHGRVIYELAGYFGITADELHPRSEFYRERFGVTKEKS